LKQGVYKKNFNCPFTQNDDRFDFCTLKTFVREKIYSQGDMRNLGAKLALSLLDCFLDEEDLENDKLT
jgi:hypothetical protein